MDEGLEPWKVRQVLVSGVERPNLWVDVSATLERGLAGAALPREPDRRLGRGRGAASVSAPPRWESRWACRMAQAFLSILLT